MVKFAVKYVQQQSIATKKKNFILRNAMTLQISTFT